MGHFDVAMPCHHGRVHVQRARNCLMWRAQARLLSAILPTKAATTFTYEIGFAGPMLRDWLETPIPPDVPVVPHAIDRRWSVSDFTSGSLGGGNDGCSPETDIRNIYGYARKAVEWQVVNDPRGAMAFTLGDATGGGGHSGWYLWTNRVSWAPHGDWTPGTWDPLWGAYPQPYGWTDCRPWEGPDNVTNPGHSFPWCSPRIHPDWWNDTGPINNNPWGVACSSCALMTPHQMAGWRSVCAYILVSGGGDQEAYAAAMFKAPTGWRLGGNIAVRYSGRWGA